jgi:hypothetical protein
MKTFISGRLLQAQYLPQSYVAAAANRHLNARSQYGYMIIFFIRVNSGDLLDVDNKRSM